MTSNLDPASLALKDAISWIEECYRAWAPYGMKDAPFLDGPDARITPIRKALAYLDTLSHAGEGEPGRTGVVVTIKPLEWRAVGEHWQADCSIGWYSVRPEVADDFTHTLWFNGNPCGFAHRSEAEAIAAGNADYTSKIERAVAKPAPQAEPFGWVITSKLGNENFTRDAEAVKALEAEGVVVTAVYRAPQAEGHTDPVFSP